MKCFQLPDAPASNSIYPSLFFKVQLMYDTQYYWHGQSSISTQTPSSIAISLMIDDANEPITYLAKFCNCDLEIYYNLRSRYSNGISIELL